MSEVPEQVSVDDPIEAARRGARPQLRRRFFDKATVAIEGGSHVVCLDGKPIRTPGRRLLATPMPLLADALAAEWDAQRDFVDPAKMPLTRLANSIIDGVALAPLPVAEEIARYLESDLLFYRAAAPAGLVERQARHWNPILSWARDDLGAPFHLGEGVTHVSQPEAAVAAARAAIPSDPWRLGAANAVTTLTGSALIALAMAHGRLSPDAAWAAAHVDEDWNMEQWGSDALALERRAFQFAEFQAAALILQM